MITIPGTRRAQAALATALVVAGGIAVTTNPFSDPAPEAGTNLAFIDTAATDQVMKDVGRAAEAAFTIHPKTVDATRASASEVLTGDAVAQYADIYGPYLEKALAEGLTLITSVRAIGVTSLESDEATLLVLADQAGRTATGQSGVGPAQLKLRAERTGGTWKISSIELL